MYVTTRGSLVRTDLKVNKLFWLPLFCWFHTGFMAGTIVLDRQDWSLKTCWLGLSACPYPLLSQGNGTGSNWPELSVRFFFFVMLHLYGAFYAYTQNALGSWLQNKFHLWRNPYDRIVHFSFGLFAAYPFRELLINKFRVSTRASWLLPIEIAFSFRTIFELIEWGVSVVTKETGETYVATQGWCLGCT